MKTLLILASLTLGVSGTFAAEPAVTATVPATELPAVNHLVYLNELPESADLMQNAAANGLTVKRLDRTSDRVVITYSYPNGSTATMGYALLSSAGNTDRVALNPQRETRVVEQRTVTVVTPEPEIIYYERSYPRTRYVYRDPMDNFWLPLTLGVGIGWATGHHGHHGYYRSYNGHHDYREDHGYGHRGGWRH